MAAGSLCLVGGAAGSGRSVVAAWVRADAGTVAPAVAVAQVGKDFQLSLAPAQRAGWGLQLTTALVRTFIGSFFLLEAGSGRGAEPDITGCGRHRHLVGRQPLPEQSQCTYGSGCCIDRRVCQQGGFIAAYGGTGRYGAGVVRTQQPQGAFACGIVERAGLRAVELGDLVTVGIVYAAGAIEKPIGVSCLGGSFRLI